MKTLRSPSIVSEHDKRDNESVTTSQKFDETTEAGTQTGRSLPDDVSEFFREWFCTCGGERKDPAKKL